MRKIFLIMMTICLAFITQACKQDLSFESIDLEVSAGIGIQVSFDGENWSNALDSKETAAYLHNAYQSFEFIHLTTQTGYNAFQYMSNQELIETESGYIEIPIYFRSATATQIGWSQATLCSAPKTIKSEISFESHLGPIEVDEEFYYCAANAYRVSVQGTVNGDENHVTVFEVPDQYNYNRVLNDGGDYSGDGTGYPGAYQYYYEINNELFPGSENVVVVPSTTNLRQVTVLDLVYDAEKDTNLGMLTIRIWCELYDPDSYSFAIDDAISVSLSFVGK